MSRPSGHLLFVNVVQVSPLSAERMRPLGA